LNGTIAKHHGYDQHLLLACPTQVAHVLTATSQSKIRLDTMNQQNQSQIKRQISIPRAADVYPGELAGFGLSSASHVACVTIEALELCMILDGASDE
jgi:hypothetical protein